MSRSQTAKHIKAEASPYGGVRHHNVLGDLAAKGLAKVAPHTAPWLLGVGMFPAGYGTHALWGTAEAIPWASAALALSGATLTGISWHVSRYRHILGRLQSTATTAVASGWLLAATITGPTSRPTLDIGLWLGGTLAAAWNIRNIIRVFEPEGEGGELAVTGNPRNLFKRLLKDTAEKSGKDIAVTTVKVEPNRISGKVELSDGDTAEDLQRIVPAMEAAGRLPSGALVVTPDPENAGTPTVTLTDPLLLKDPILWPGPSRPGRSIAEPLRVGMFQDGTHIEIVIVGSHLQIMGMTGSAKSTGIGWSILGEVMTRDDVVVLFVDVTKGKQTVGPMEPAMHRVESNPAGAQALMDEIQAILSQRTDDLAALDLLKWAPGCGLPYLILWIEEAADVFDRIEMTEFINLMRAIRSAGGSIVWSLQRADSTQMPTMVKGQGGGWICAGVANDHDAGWGLSPAQEKAGAAPELWGKKRPGMAYVDMDGVDPERVALPGRFYDWGTTDEERVANMRAHAASWPATRKPVDPTTAKLVEGFITPDEDSVPMSIKSAPADHLRTEDPDPSTPTPDVDAPLADCLDTPLGAPATMSHADARVYLDRYLERFADGRPFGPKDLGRVLEDTGFKRGWLQKVLKEKAEAGVLEHDRDNGVYRMRVLTPA